jgi:ketosteroid isomerase-like protein
MNKKSLLIIVLISAIVSPWIALARDDSQAEREIGKLREGLIDSFNKGDIDRLITYLDTNAVVTWQNGEVCEGTAAVKAYYERMMKGDHPVVLKVTSDPKVLGRHIQGDWCVSWGDLNDRFQLSDGRELPFNSHFTATLALRGDHWMVSAFHVSVNAFDNPITTLAVKKISVIVGVAALIAGFLLALLLTRVLARSKSAPK